VKDHEFLRACAGAIESDPIGVVVNGWEDRLRRIAARLEEGEADDKEAFKREWRAARRTYADESQEARGAYAEGFREGWTATRPGRR